MRRVSAGDALQGLNFSVAGAGILLAFGQGATEAGRVAAHEAGAARLDYAGAPCSSAVAVTEALRTRVGA